MPSELSNLLAKRGALFSELRQLKFGDWRRSEIWDEIDKIERKIARDESDLRPKQITLTSTEAVEYGRIIRKERKKPEFQRVSKTQRRQQRRRILIGQAKAKYRSGQNPKRLQRGLARKGVRVKKLKRY